MAQDQEVLIQSLSQCAGRKKKQINKEPAIAKQTTQNPKGVKSKTKSIPNPSCECNKGMTAAPMLCQVLVHVAQKFLYAKERKAQDARK